MSSQQSMRPLEPEVKAHPGDMLKPFRLLGLPRDIRLMIYEQLPFSQNAHTIPLQDRTHHINLLNPSISGIRILSTCRLINEEASYVLKPRMRRILQQPPRIIIEADHLVGLIQLHDGLSWNKDVLDRICQGVNMSLRLNTIHRYRKGECDIASLRKKLGFGKLLDECDHEAVRAISSFVLRVAKWQESKPGLEGDKKYPTLTVVIDIPSTFQISLVTTTTSRTKVIFYRLSTNTRRSRTQHGPASLSWLLRRLAYELVLKGRVWKKFTFEILMRYAEDECGGSMMTPEFTESDFRAAIMMGINDWRGSDRGQMIYGGLIQSDEEDEEGIVAVKDQHGSASGATQ